MRIPRTTLAFLLLLAAPHSHAQTKAPAASTRQPAKQTPTGPTVVIDTTMGRLTCRLYATQAPELTANFIGLAEGTQDWKDSTTGELQHGKPFYDGTALFGATASIGGGDRRGDGTGTAGDPLTVAKPKGLTFDHPGRLAMYVRQGKISRSMFFISDHSNAEFDEGNRGAIFGDCDSASVERVTSIAHLLHSTDNHPTTPVAINKISVIQPGQPMPPLAPDVAAATVVPQPSPAPANSLLSIDPTGPTAHIETSLGTISCRLFEREAPIATGIFIGLARGTKDWIMPHTHTVMHGKPFYDGLLFNRVVPDFMIQNQNYPGGATGGGEIGIAYSIEVVPGLTFDRPGRLAMANSGPDKNDSSFFITDQPSHAGLDEHFTIFGQCDDASVKIVAAIARVPRNEHNRPITPVVIRHITIVK